MRHTAGPWAVTGSCWVDKFTADGALDYPAGDGSGEHHSIARTYGTDQEANAQLIAAAPDLLAELIAAGEIIRQLSEAIVKYIPTSDPVFVVDVRLPEREATIAKAEAG